QRTWFLKRSLLCQHSNFFRAACYGQWEEGNENRIILADEDPRVFADFVDFMQSNIYSLNTLIEGFNMVPSHAKAWVLGDKLGALSFRTAALHKLHQYFIPYSLDPYISAFSSPIRPIDIAYICTHTAPLYSPFNHPSSSALRSLFFDAVSSHWARIDILNIDEAMDICGEELSWRDVYTAYGDFKDHLVDSLKVPDAWRNVCLRDVEVYLGLGVKKEEAEEDKVV
ncbi:uncharacterized protein BDR25DRAFT_167467, partial [Lindgomyces ingoldianus]